MAKKCGRPAKSADQVDSKQRIIDTTIDLIRKKELFTIISETKMTCLCTLSVRLPLKAVL